MGCDTFVVAVAFAFAFVGVSVVVTVSAVEIGLRVGNTDAALDLD